MPERERESVQDYLELHLSEKVTPLPDIQYPTKEILDHMKVLLC